VVKEVIKKYILVGIEDYYRLMGLMVKCLC